jgi:hypothetical protein
MAIIIIKAISRVGRNFKKSIGLKMLKTRLWAGFKHFFGISYICKKNIISNYVQNWQEKYKRLTNDDKINIFSHYFIL